MNPTGVLFDLDGTLLDSLGDIAAAMNAVLARRGHPAHPLDAYRRFVGDGIEMLVRRALPGALSESEVTAALQDMREEYAQRSVETTRPYPGVPELLDALVARRVPIGIVTNKPQQPAVAMVAALLGTWPFSVVVGARDGLPRKPDPTGAREAARQMGLHPASTWYVGDTAVDMLMAVAAGMRPAAALWGFRTETELRTAGAKVLLHRPGDLLQHLDAVT